MTKHNHVSPLLPSINNQQSPSSDSWSANSFAQRIQDTVPCDRPKANMLIGSNDLMNPISSDDETCSISVKSDASESSSRIGLSYHHSLIVDHGEVVSSIAEGWLNKKGSGNDIVGSRGFKPRWTRLVLMSVPPETEINYDLLDKDQKSSLKEVPVLQMFWHQYSFTPCSYIVLDENISGINPITKSNHHSWTAATVYRFEIVVNDPTSSSFVTKTFCAPLKERNQWVDALRMVLRKKEDEERKLMAERRRRELPPTPKQFRKPANIRLRVPQS